MTGLFERASNGAQITNLGWPKAVDPGFVRLALLLDIVFSNICERTFLNLRKYYR